MSPRKKVVTADQAVSVVPLVLPNQTNLGRFLTDSSIPQIVCIPVNESKFLVNSIVLSLNSSVLKEQILKLSPEDHTLLLDEDLLSIPVIESVVRDCLEYLHGESISLSFGNVHYFCKFATVYKINHLISTCKVFIEEHVGCLTIQELLENYSDFDEANIHRSPSAYYIEKNCDRIIKDIISVDGSPIICGLQENVQFLKFLVKSSSSKNCGKLLLLLTKSEQFDSNFLLDFPLDRLNYKDVFPIFADFQKFMKLLITSVKDTALVKNKSLLKRLCLVSRILGNDTQSKLEVSLSSNFRFETSDQCLVETSSLSPIVINGGTITSIDVAVKASGTKAVLVENKSQAICTSNDASDPKWLRNFLREIPAYDTKVKRKKKVEIMLEEICIELDQQVRRNRLGDYYRVELFLGWVLKEELKLDIALYERFLKSFNFMKLSKTFLKDSWSLCSLFYKSFQENRLKCLDELSNDNNFFVIQRKLSSAEIQKSIISSGNIVLPGTSLCLINKCDTKDHSGHHTIGKISIKLRVSTEDQSCGLIRKNQHQKDLEHYYMTLFDKDLTFSGLISVKILTKNDILTIVKNYSYFFITLIYKN